MPKNKKTDPAGSYQSRLEELNRGVLKHTPVADRKEGPDKRRPEPSISISEPTIRINGSKAEFISIEEAVPGQSTTEDVGDFLLIKQRFKDFRDDARITIKRFPERLKNLQTQHTGLTNPVLETLKTVHPSKILFLDIETCGLSNAPLFLIGVAYFTGEDFSFLQLFARNLCEERPLLSFFNKLLSQYDLLVTYNGRSFDIPFIISRGHANKVRIPNCVPNLDLLHEVRRIWKPRLPNCKLQTVEQHIYGRKRCGDIHGDDIPHVYNEFVKTGNAGMIRTILKHNILDVITMIDIITDIYAGELDSNY